MKRCLYCNQEDGGRKNKYRPGKNVDFVCSMCVIILCDTHQAELKHELEIAIEKKLDGDTLLGHIRIKELQSQNEKLINYIIKEDICICDSQHQYTCMKCELLAEIKGE